jgi:hypothetical protein
LLFVAAGQSSSSVCAKWWAVAVSIPPRSLQSDGCFKAQSAAWPAAIQL